MEGDLVRGVASICINYAEMRKYEHEQKEILPSNIGRRKNYNSWRAMMRGATWNPMMPRLDAGTALPTSKAIKFERVAAAISWLSASKFERVGVAISWLSVEQAWSVSV